MYILNNNLITIFVDNCNARYDKKIKLICTGN